MFVKKSPHSNPLIMNQLKLQKHQDIRPAISDSWNMVRGYPRPVTVDELRQLLPEDTTSHVDVNATAHIYKYVNDVDEQSCDKVIVLVFNANYECVISGEYQREQEVAVTASETRQLDYATHI